MAEVDSRIAMGVQAPDIAGAVGRGFQLRDLAAQADTRAIDNQLRQQAMQKQATLGDLYRGAVGADGKIDRAKISQGMAGAGYGADLPVIQKQWSDADKAEADYLHKNNESIIKQLDYTNKAIGGLLSNPNVTADDVVRQIAGLTQFGLMKPEQGAQIAREVPADPAQLRQYLMLKAQQAQQAKDMLTNAMPQLQAVNLGGTTQMVDINPVTNPGAVGKTLQRTPTPGEVEQQRHNGVSEVNTVRGQNLTDARARDFNQVKVEENKLKREAKEEAANQAKAGQLASFDTMLGTLERLSTHPGLEKSVGLSSMLPTMPGSDSANFQAELETFKSQAFIPMVSQLKGMGALSDAEGKKLTAAVGALSPTMSKEAFKKSIAQVTKTMTDAKDRLSSPEISAMEAELRRRGLLK